MREKRDGTALTVPPLENPDTSQSLTPKSTPSPDLARLLSRTSEHGILRAALLGVMDAETDTLIDGSDVAAAHDIVDAGDAIARLARLGQHYELGRTGTSTSLYRRGPA